MSNLKFAQINEKHSMGYFWASIGKKWDALWFITINGDGILFKSVCNLFAAFPNNKDLIFPSVNSTFRESWDVWSENDKIQFSLYNKISLIIFVNNIL